MLNTQDFPGEKAAFSAMAAPLVPHAGRESLSLTLPLLAYHLPHAKNPLCFRLFPGDGVVAQELPSSCYYSSLEAEKQAVHTQDMGRMTRMASTGGKKTAALHAVDVL